MIEFDARLVGIIVVGVVIEFAAIAIWFARTGRTRLIRPLGYFLGAGASLMVALRFALLGGLNLGVAAAMFSALLFHLAMLVWLFRR
ncbi:MAG: hypothetical protein ACFB00_04880 [Parvularculaceae bacterium]